MSLTPLFTNIRPTIVWLLIATFSCCGLYVPQGHADVMPSPGVRVSLSPEFSPYLLNGIKIDPNNPLRFEFLMSQSDEGNQDQIKMQEEANKLIKYFLASITVPENDLWVNLSPYEKDKVIPSGFGETGMGRDLLAQDYLLKQITASLMYPEDDLGKKFWQEIYKQAVKAGVQNVPVNTFNKVWIVPEKAVVYENGAINAAFVGEARLKVMLEEDYLATNKFLATISESTHQSSRHLAKKSPQGASPSGALPLRADGSQSEIATKEIIRSIILPALEKEVNEGKNFATLRQVYNSLILASWYKKKIKNSLLSKAYANQNKVKGTEDESAKDPNEVYGQYLKAFKKGVYNLIKEETDPVTQQSVMRKYFAGGIDFAMQATSLEVGNGLEIKDVTAGGMLTKLRDGLSKKVYSVIAAVKLRQEVEIYSKKNLKEEKTKDIYRGLKGLTAQQTIEILQQGEQPRFRKVDGMREGRNWVFQISGLLDKNTLSTTTKFSSARMYAFWSYFYEKHYQTKSMASTVVVTAQSHLRQAMMVFKDLGLKMFDYRFVTKDKVVLHGKPSEVLKQIQEMVSKNNRGLSINLVYRAQVQPEQIKWKALRLGHYLAPTGQEIGVNQVFPEDLKEVWAYVAVNDNAMTTQGDPNLADLSRQIDLIRAPEEAANLANQLEAMDILTWRLIEGHVKDDGVLKDLLKELIGKKFINLELAHKADVYKELGFFRFNSQKSQEIVAQLVNQKTNVAEDEMKKLMTAQQSGEPIRNLIARYGELLVQVVVLKDKYFDFERTAFGENLARFFEYVINQENVGVSITPAIKVEAENIAKLIRTRAINETAYFKTKAELEGVIDRDEVDGIKARVESVMMVAIARGLVYSDTEEIVTGEGVAALAKYAKELKSLAKSDKQQEVVVALTEVGQKVDFWPNENQMPQAYLAWGKFLQLYEGLSDDKAMKTTENIIAPSVALTDDGVKQAIDVLIGKNISIGELKQFINGFGDGNTGDQMKIFEKSGLIQGVLDQLAEQTIVEKTEEKVRRGFIDPTANEYWDMARELHARWSAYQEAKNMLERLNKMEGVTKEDIEAYFDVMDNVTMSDSLKVGMIAEALSELNNVIGYEYSNSAIEQVRSSYKNVLRMYVINGLGKEIQASEEYLIGATRFNIRYEDLLTTLREMQIEKINSNDIGDYTLAFQFGSPAALRGINENDIKRLEDILLNFATKVTIKATGRKLDLSEWRMNDDYWELVSEVMVQIQAIEIVNQAVPRLIKAEGVGIENIKDYFRNNDPMTLRSGPDLIVAQLMGSVTTPFRKLWNNPDPEIKDRFRNQVERLMVKYWPKEDQAMQVKDVGGIDLTNDRLALEVSCYIY